MKRDDFKGSPSGRLVPTERGQWAFVPHPLPPVEIDLAELSQPLAAAAMALGELNGIGRTLVDPLILIRPLQAREALTSSSMEGTYSTLDDLALAEAGVAEKTSTSDTIEVWNYRRALSGALSSMSDIPLSLRTLRDAHRMMLSGVSRHRGSTALPGEFKVHQNFIGGREIEAARFIPPPPREAMEALGQLESFIHRDDRNGLHDLVEAALIHYQFETIHPFADGNGRVGRMLITLHLTWRNLLRQPILYMSPVFERRKDEYIDRMFEVSKTGDWTGWIRFFLEVMETSCRQAIETSDTLLEIHQDYRRRASGAGRSSNLLTLVDTLFRSQVITIPMAASLLNVTYRAAQMNIETLLRENIISELPGSTNPKLYIARGIGDAIKKSMF
jgi:Fic family protein